MSWHIGGIYVLCLHFHSLKNAYVHTGTPDFCMLVLNTVEKFVWPGEELPDYFWIKINLVAVWPPTSCLISDLKGSWVDRAEKLILSFTLLYSFSMSAQAPSVSFMIRRWHLKEIWQHLILTHKGMFRVFITGRGCTVPYWYRDICICCKKFLLHLLWG